MRIGKKLFLAACVASLVLVTAVVAQMMDGSVTPTAGAVEPSPVPCGQQATCALSATATPPSIPYGTLSGPTWSWSPTGAPPGNVTIEHPDTSSPAATLRATFTSPGIYNVTLQATATWTISTGGSVTRYGFTPPIVIPVVGVQKLQYQQAGGGFVDATGTLYVMLGKTVTFKAVANPSGTNFPTGQPVWSGSSGASGTGETKSVTFNVTSSSTSDLKTVTATCGSTSATANVIVYDLLPIMIPRDNFVGRDQDAWGVCEFIDLSFQTVPSGISEYDIGGLQWIIVSGGGELSGGAGGVGVYQCPDVAATVVLGLVITGGPMIQEKKEDGKPVLEPDGHRMLQKPMTGIWHRENRCSIGFKA